MSVCPKCGADLLKMPASYETNKIPVFQRQCAACGEVVLAEGTSEPVELFIATKVDRVLGALENYKMRVGFIHRRAHDAQGFKRELTLDEMRRIEAAAIEARDALRELLR